MLPYRRAGIAVLDAHGGFAPATERVIGNQDPAWTGSSGSRQARPGPHPPTQPMGGQLGNADGYGGSDPGAAPLQPHPHRTVMGAEQENWNRPGIIGFNDQLQVRDRHAYWDRGRQRFGSTPSVPGNPPNPHSDGPARPDLRTVNISLNPQIGSDNSRNQDDLTRPYTWLGQQDGTSVPVYGGVPGLWSSYGNRGFTQQIHDPSDGQGGLMMVASGPPHGLHSDTMPSGKQIADRYKVTPQMRPVRQDRPDNSRIAGQSYSQTVVPQGQAPRAQAQPRSGIGFKVSGRGWLGG